MQNPVTKYVWTRVMQVRRDKDFYPCCGALLPNYESVLYSAFKEIGSFCCSVQVSVSEQVTAKEITTSYTINPSADWSFSLNWPSHQHKKL